MKKFFVLFFLSFLSLQISNPKVFAGDGGLPFDNIHDPAEFLFNYLKSFQIANKSDVADEFIVQTVTADIKRGLNLSDADVQVSVLAKGEGQKQVSISIPTHLIILQIELQDSGNFWGQTGIESVAQAVGEARIDPDAKRRILDNVIARATGVAEPANWVEDELQKLETHERERKAELSEEGHVRTMMWETMLDETLQHPLRLAPTLNNHEIADYLRYFWARELKVTEADVEVSIERIDMEGEIRLASIRVLGIAPGVTVEKWGKSLTGADNEIARILLSKTRDGWVELVAEDVKFSFADSRIAGVRDISDQANLAEAFKEGHYYPRPNPISSERAEAIRSSMTQTLYTVFRLRAESLGLTFPSQEIFGKIGQSIMRPRSYPGFSGAKELVFYNGKPTKEIWGEVLNFNEIFNDTVRLEEELTRIETSLDKFAVFGTVGSVRLGLVTRDGYLTKKGARVLGILRASLNHSLGSIDSMAGNLFGINGRWLTDFEGGSEASASSMPQSQVLDLKLVKKSGSETVPVTIAPQALQIKPWMFHALTQGYAERIFNVFTRVQSMEPVELKVTAGLNIATYRVHPRDFQLVFEPGRNTLAKYVGKYEKILRRVSRYHPGMFRWYAYEVRHRFTGRLSRWFGGVETRELDKDGKPRPPQGSGVGRADIDWGTGETQRGSGTGPSSYGGTGGLAMEAYPQGDGTLALEMPTQSIARDMGRIVNTALQSIGLIRSEDVAETERSEREGRANRGWLHGRKMPRMHR